MLQRMKKRLPRGVALLTTAICLFILFLRLDDQYVFGNNGAFILLGALLFILFAILYTFIGFFQALRCIGYMAGLFVVLALPNHLKLWGFAVFLGGMFLYGFVKREYANRKMRKSLVEDDLGLSELAAAEIAETINNVHATLPDMMTFNAHAMVEEAGQILLLYKSSIWYRTYRVFVIDNDLYFCRLRGVEAFQLSSHIPKPYTKEQADREVSDKPYNFKLELNEISEVEIVKGKMPKRYLISVPVGKERFVLKSDGATILDDVVHFFGSVCNLRIEHTITSPNDEIIPSFSNLVDEMDHVDATQLRRRRKVRMMVKILNVIAALFAIWILMPIPGTLSVKIMLNMLVPLVGYGIYIKYSPLVSIDSNKQGAPNISGIVMLAPLSTVIFFVMFAAENNVPAFSKWLVLALIITMILFCILYLTTKKYKVKKSIWMSILMCCLFSSFGISAGAIMMLKLIFNITWS